MYRPNVVLWDFVFSMHLTVKKMKTNTWFTTWYISMLWFKHCKMKNGGLMKMDLGQSCCRLTWFLTGEHVAYFVVFHCIGKLFFFIFVSIFSTPSFHFSTWLICKLRGTKWWHFAESCQDTTGAGWAPSTNLERHTCIWWCVRSVVSILLLLLVTLTTQGMPNRPWG